MPRKPKEQVETVVEPKPIMPPGTIYFHVGEGSRVFREAVMNIPVGADKDTINATIDTVNNLMEAFPLPSVDSVSWYTNAFIAAYLPISNYQRLVAMLASMESAGTVKFGDMVLNWGKKFPNATLAELAKNPDGVSYIEWVKTQNNTDSTRICAAWDAYKANNLL
jgi:hypothetical protein